MYKEEAFFTYSKILKHTGLILVDKLILVILIQYWKNSKYKKKDYIDTVSFTFLKNMLGLKDTRTVSKSLDKLIKKDFLTILNREDVQYKHHTPRIILKEEKINVYFNGSFFNTTGKKQYNKPAGTAQSSTSPYKNKETGVATPKERAAAPTTPPSWKDMDYIANINKQLLAIRKEPEE